MGGDGEDLFAANRVPKVDRPVLIGRRDALTVGTESQVKHAGRVALEGEPLLAAIDMPERNGTLQFGRRQPQPVGTEHETVGGTKRERTGEQCISRKSIIDQYSIQ